MEKTKGAGTRIKRQVDRNTQLETDRKIKQTNRQIERLKHTNTQRDKQRKRLTMTHNRQAS